MYAGSDITAVPALVRRIQSQLDAHVAATMDWIAIDVFKRVLSGAFQAERQERATDQVLSPYGLTFHDLFTKGIALLGEAEAGVVRERFVSTALNCELLGFGFSGPLNEPSRALPHVMVLSDPGVVAEYDEPGYWAIGSGAYAALSALAVRRQSRLRLLPETIYNVCEAKFAAEFAVGVGRETYVTVHKSDRTTALTLDEVTAVRSEWENVGRPREPVGVLPSLLSWMRQDSRWIKLSERRPTVPVDRPDRQGSTPESTAQPPSRG
jgi:hypothetical protein